MKSKLLKPFLIFFGLGVIFFGVKNSFFAKKTTHQIVGFFQEENENEAENETQIGKPDEEWLQQRLYPFNDEASMLRGYDQFLAQVTAEVAANANAKTPLAGLWTQEGPGNVGARFNTIAIHPTNPNIVYAGSAAGGLWKTTDGGGSWNPIFDQNSYLNIGCIVLDKTNPNTVFVGTGDPNIGGYVRIGDGVWKSTNGGANWTNIGLGNTRIISSIVQHPTQPNTMWVAAMGLPFARDANRGVYKTTNGGVTWTKILYAGDDTGASSLIIDPNNPNILYTTTWTRIRNNHETLLTGVNSRIWKSIDGGTTWNPLSTDLPSGKQGRIGLAITKNAPTKLYAMYMDTASLAFGGLYKSSNAGANWTEVGAANNINMSFQGNQSWYFGKIRINPVNDNEVWLLGVNSEVSFDGGASWSDGTGQGQAIGSMHSDHHDLAWDNSGLGWLATDGGIFKGSALNWERSDNMPTNQIYRCAVNPNVSGDYAVGVQDNGTSFGNALVLNNWQKYWYGDGFQMLFDPNDPSLWYASSQNGNLVQSADGGASFFGMTTGIDASESHNWDTPFRMSKFNSNILYTGTSRVYRYDGGAATWQPISPILSDTINDRFHNISTIEESPLDANKIWVGTTDARVQMTLDGGANWINRTAGLPSAYVTAVKPSLHNANTAFVALSGYRENDNTPRLWKTTNNGATWTSVSGNLPQGAINDIELYQNNPNVMFVATDGGVYATINAGATWTRVGSNMPIIPVYDLETDRVNNKLLAGTFARSLMSFNIAELVATANIEIVQKMTVFPNPATSVLNLKNASDFNSIDIFDITGKLVFSSKTSVETINIQNLHAGAYLIRAYGQNKQFVAKFVKIEN